MGTNQRSEEADRGGATWEGDGADDLLSSLTAAQREAVLHIEGPQLILAGPGSGKTRVVTHRIAHMLRQGIPGDRILALTFTNKAADEMRERVERLAPRSRVWLGTFHRFCAQQLRRHASLVGLRENFSIYDSDDSLKLLREAIAGADVELIHEAPGRVAGAIGWAKNDLITPEAYCAAPGDPLGAIVQRVYPHYQRRLLAANAVDFDDLLMHMAVLLRENSELRVEFDERFCYIMVDEYQDTNLAQYAIVRAMSVQHPNLSVTGDPDQSIYGWRGATMRNILEFERDFAHVHVVRLEENFRSTKAILRSADQLISNNTRRKEKTLYTGNPEGEPVRLVVYPSGRQEADAIAARIANEVAGGRRRARDYAIFYRTNALSRTLERSVRSVGLRYQIVRGLEFYQRKEIKDVLAYLQLLNNPASDVALLRIINTPPRKIGATTIKRLSQYARQKRLSLFDAARQAGLIDSLAKRTAVEVARFVAMMDQMHLTGGEMVEDVIGRLLHVTGYRQWLSAGESEEDMQRVANVDELLTDAREFDEMHGEDGGVEAFLEQASLVADIDDWETEVDCVTMMTLHAAKGLEFPVVFIVALEDDTIPHARSKERPDQLEEERRLLFVGITRAREELHLSAALQRTRRGKVDTVAASPFLQELPREEMETGGLLSHGGYDYSHFAADSSWNNDDWSGDEAWGDEALSSGDDSCYVDDDHRKPAPSRKQRPKRTTTKQKRTARTSQTSASTGVPFVTAAQLAGSTDAASEAKFPPEAFRHGMVVMHPEYGLGKIISLGGSGLKRSAKVQFGVDAGTRTFRLAFSQLRPIGS